MNAKAICYSMQFRLKDFWSEMGKYYNKITHTRISNLIWKKKMTNNMHSMPILLYNYNYTRYIQAFYILTIAMNSKRFCIFKKAYNQGL